MKEGRKEGRRANESGYIKYAAGLVISLCVAATLSDSFTYRPVLSRTSEESKGFRIVV